MTPYQFFQQTFLDATVINYLLIALMKSIYIAFLLLNSSTPLYSQFYYSKSIDVAGKSDNGVAINKTQDGYIILAGSMCKYDCTSLIKVDFSGNKIWQKQILNSSGNIKPSDNYGNHGLLIKDSSIFLSGITEIANNKYDAFLFKSNFLGDSLWLKNYGGKMDDINSTLISNSDTTIVLFGDASINNENDEISLLEIDTNGIIIEEINFMNNFNMVGRQDILKLANGDIVFTYITCGKGENCGIDIEKELVITRINNKGDIIWAKEVWNFTELWGNSSLVSLNNGGFLISFYRENFEEGWFYPPILLWTDSLGVVVNRYDFPQSSESAINDLIITSSGIIVGTGYVDKLELGYAGWIFGINQEGNLLWNRELIDQRFPMMLSNLNAVIENEDKGFTLVGFIMDTIIHNNQSELNQNIWLVKIDSLGCVKAGCDKTQIISIQKEIANNKNKIIIYPTLTHDYLFINNIDRIDILRGPYLVYFSNLDGRTYHNPIFDINMNNRIDISSFKDGLYFIQIYNEKGMLICSQKFIKI